jgi:hypothetical protein
MQNVSLADARELEYERAEIRPNGRLYAYGPGDRCAWFASDYWVGLSDSDDLVIAMSKVIRPKGDAGRVPDAPEKTSRAITNGKVTQKPAIAKIELRIKKDEDEDVLRLLECRVDLVQTYQEGIEPLEVLPGSGGAIFKGKRHQIAAPTNDGKSFGELIRAADMAVAGARVVVLDRENGREVYAERLQIVVEARGWGPEEEKLLKENLLYFEYPILNRNGGDALQAVAEMFRVDCVVFDSQRMILTDMGLRENESDDYSEFMEKLIDPLFRCGIATVVLDNTGHDEQDRSRGTSSKQDLHDQIYVLKKVRPFDRDQKGSVALTTKKSRTGAWGAFELELGGGHVGCWRGRGALTGFKDAVKLVVEAGQISAVKTILQKLREDQKIQFNDGVALRDIKEMVQDPACPLERIDGKYVWRT